MEAKRPEWLSEPEGRSSGQSRVQDHIALFSLLEGVEREGILQVLERKPLRVVQ